MSPIILNADERQELEKRMANRLGERALMERAGHAAAQLIMTRLHWEAGTSGAETAPALSVTMLAGPGNNGGDALACAAELKAANVDVVVVLPGGRRPKSPLAQAQYARYEALGGTFESDPYMARPASVVVDGLFGTGLNKPIAGEYLDALLWFNERQAFKLALDVPSGLNEATGHWVGAFGCQAHATLTFLSAKAGLYMNEGAQASGEIIVDDLGVSVPLTRLSLICEDDFSHVVQPLNKNLHKGSFGHCGIIAGSEGMIGAALLCARAASDMGAGTVTLECLAQDAPAVDMVYPQIMMSQRLDFDKIDVLAIGCGLGKGEKAKARVKDALAFPKPLVIDADALNIIAEDLKLQDDLLAREAPTVITPHPGEAARLLRRSIAEVQVDRVAACRELAVQTGAIVLLKGAGTVISLRSSRTWINPARDSSLAVAGSGDVLTGIIASLFAQKYDMTEAVLAGAYFHAHGVKKTITRQPAHKIGRHAIKLLDSMRLRQDPGFKLR